MSDLFPNTVPNNPRALYLDLMKRSLTNWIYLDTEIQLAPNRPFTLSRWAEGRDWPATAHTMIGLKRLDNLQHCVETCLQQRIPGDLLEAGVWRGGAAIFMRAVLQVYDEQERCVWVADSFEGLPPPNPEKYPHDAGSVLHRYPQLAISLEQVRSNFMRYGLLDHQVRFLQGWFRDTLPCAPVQQLAVLRLDGDMYESTMDALTNLYPALSVGGFLIVDDYGDIAACRQAVHDYRQAHGIRDEIVPIDWTGAYWRRER